MLYMHAYRCLQVFYAGLTWTVCTPIGTFLQICPKSPRNKHEKEKKSVIQEMLNRTRVPSLIRLLLSAVFKMNFALVAVT